MLDGGDGACAIEVSSHALELGRAGGVAFAAAVFTNLTQDHLDFHATMEDYFLAKRRLFVEHGADGIARRQRGRLLRAAAGGRARGRRRYRTRARSRSSSRRDYSASDLRCDLGGCTFTLHAAGLTRELRLPMPGRFNVANALGALLAAHELLGRERLAELIAALELGVHVPGRFEPVDEGQDFAVLVDYAHTPDSLENVLAAAREPRRVGPGGGRRASSACSAPAAIATAASAR